MWQILAIPISLSIFAYMWKELEILRNKYLDLQLNQVIDYEKFSIISIIYHNEPFVKIFTEDRAEYIDSMNLTEEKGDISIFRDFICRQQIKFYKSEIEKYKKQGKGFSLLF